MKKENIKILQAEVIFAGKYDTYQKYSYLTTITDLEKDEWVVVKSKTGYGVAKFSNYTPRTFIATSWIVQKINIADHRKMLASIGEI
jgi:urocanate hydratase